MNLSFLAQPGARRRFVAGLVLVALAVAWRLLLTAKFSGHGEISWQWVGRTLAPGLALLVSGPLLLAPWRSYRLLRWTADLWAITAVTVALLLAVEGLCWAGRKIHARAQDNNPNYRAPPVWRFRTPQGARHDNIHLVDNDLGYKLAPGIAVQAERLGRAGNVLYTARYTTDAQGHRVTPLTQSGPRDKFILFFNDSYIFGEGVSDDETLPARVGELAPAYRPYNFGVGGYGPHQMMLQLAGGQAEPAVKEKSGILIYLFYDHILRVVGTLNTYKRPHNTPFYRLDANDNLVSYKRADLQRTWRGKLALILGASNLRQTLRFDWPRIGPREMLAATKVIQASRDEFKNRFHSDEFYVLIYPGPRGATIIPYPQAAGIKYLDYSQLFNPTATENHLFQDSHPSPLAYRKVAERLAQDLRLAQK